MEEERNEERKERELTPSYEELLAAVESLQEEYPKGVSAYVLVIKRFPKQRVDDISSKLANLWKKGGIGRTDERMPQPDGKQAMYNYFLKPVHPKTIQSDFSQISVGEPQRKILAVECEVCKALIGPGNQSPRLQSCVCGTEYYVERECMRRLGSPIFFRAWVPDRG